MAHGVTPDALRRGAARRRPGARAAFVVSPTYYGLAADVAGLRRGRARRAASPLVVDQSWGPHFGFHPDVPAERAAPGRRRGAHLDAQDRRLADAVGDAARRRRPAASTPTRVARAVRLVRSTSQSSLLMALAGRRPPPAGRPRPGAAVAHAARPRTRCARRSTRIPGCARGGGGPRRPRRASRPGTRCGSSSTSAAPAAPATRSTPRCARPTTRSSSSPPTRRVVLVLGIAQPADDLERFAHDFAETIGRISVAGRAPRRSPARRPRCTTRSRCRRATRSSAASSASPIDDAEGRVSSESIAGYPPGHPGAAARASAITARGDRLPARARRARGARLHGASTPDARAAYVVARQPNCAMRAGWLVRVRDRTGRSHAIPLLSCRRRYDRGACETSWTAPSRRTSAPATSPPRRRSRRRARRRHDHAEGAGRHLRPRRRRGGLPPPRPRLPDRARAGGRVARARRGRAARRGLGARAADRRADGAELPAAAVRHRDA